MDDIATTLHKIVQLCCTTCVTQTWFITGSSRGLVALWRSPRSGQATSLPRPLADPEQLADLIAEFGDRVLPLALDVTDAGAATSTLAAARERFGRLDVIVNNAGTPTCRRSRQLTIQTSGPSSRRTFWGVYHLSKAAIPLLRQQAAD